MKKFIIFLTAIVTLVLIVAISIPIIFKEDIQQKIRFAINDSVDAHVYFEPSKFGLTLFKHFPNPTASMEDFGIVGMGEFQGDTLLSVGSFNVTIDIFSLFGDRYKIESINLIKPNINLITKKGGNANYKIVSESGTTNKSDVDDSFNLSIDSWNISNGAIRYNDEDMDFSMNMEGLNHTGRGNISSEVYDLITQTSIDKMMVSYGGIKYLSGQQLFADLTININIPDNIFSFKENEIRINDFPLNFDGYVAFPNEELTIDISFASTNSSIKSLYSIVPGVFTEDYKEIIAEGQMSFSGMAKGKYNTNSIPAFNLKLTASNGKIAYPELPTPISNINIDLLIDCKDGKIENTKIDIKKAHMDMGNNPLDGTLLIRNLKDYSMKADITASLNLSELSSMFPIEGLDLKGLFFMNLKADGIYDSIRNIIPSLDATISIENGYIKSSDFPKALENILFNSSINCATGKMKDMIVLVKEFDVAMEGEKLTGDLVLKNLENYQWDLKLKGGIDLEVFSQVYPIEEMKYSGHLNVDIETRGSYADVEAERYDLFPTKGNIELSDFNFVSADLPKGMNISNSKIYVNPQEIDVRSFDGKIGKSDMKLNGFIKNYIQYLFEENETLKGKLTLKSTVMDFNEWMTDNNEEETDKDSIEMEVIVIPDNIDFEFNSSIENIYYDNLNLKNGKGLMTIRDGVLDMDNLSFGLFDGSIIMNGKYDTRKPDKPKFDYNLLIKNLSISHAFTSFSMVKTFVPMARHMEGKFSSNFDIKGLLNNDLSPVNESLNGNGIIQISEATVKDSKLVSGITGFLKASGSSTQLTMKDVFIKASLENGRAFVSPFDVKLAGQKASISGSIGADGSLDYHVSTEVDAGAVGQQVNQIIAGLKGEDSSEVSTKIKLNFTVRGTYDEPKIVLAGTTSEAGVTNTIKQEASDVVEKQIEDVKEQAEELIVEETKELLEKGEEQIQQQLDTLLNGLSDDFKDEAEKIIGEELDSTANELKNALQNLFRKKK